MAFDLSAEFQKTDAQKEREIQGRWMEITGGAKLLIARAGNDNYMREYNKIPRAIRQRLESGKINTKKAEPLIADLIATTILLGWEGMADKGKAITYSVDAAAKYLIEYPPFFNLVWDLANEEEEDDEELAQEETKN